MKIKLLLTIISFIACYSKLYSQSSYLRPTNPEVFKPYIITQPHLPLATELLKRKEREFNKENYQKNINTIVQLIQLNHALIEELQNKDKKTYRRRRNHFKVVLDKLNRRNFDYSNQQVFEAVSEKLAEYGAQTIKMMQQ